MYASLKSRVQTWERSLRRRYGRDISTPQARRRAWWHFQLLDHAILRIVWWNLAEIAPGVWRSNQPSPKRLARYKRMGIRSVINLRGVTGHSPYLFQEEACRELGLTLHNITLSARKLVPRQDILTLIAVMRSAERPFVLHCKSGSDRAGFAAALYLAVIEGRPVAEARRQLHWRFLHLASTDTGILDHVFDVYEAQTAQAPQDLETWFATRYDHEALTASWRAKRGAPLMPRAAMAEAQEAQMSEAMERRVFAVTGQDRESFLQGLVTNDVGKLAHGPVYAALLTPQGKYLCDFFLVARDDAILIDAPAALAEDLAKRLSMYKLRAKVAIEATDLVVSQGAGDPPPGAFADPRADGLGWRLIAERRADGMDPAGWAALRVAHGVPEAGLELVPGETYILEAGLDRLHGVDFAKGCFVGQEVVARMKHKTKLNKGVVRVGVDGAAPVGTPIEADGLNAGMLYTQAGGEALAFIRFKRASEEMIAGDATVRLLEPLG